MTMNRHFNPMSAEDEDQVDERDAYLEESQIESTQFGVRPPPSADEEEQ